MYNKKWNNVLIVPKIAGKICSLYASLLRCKTEYLNEGVSKLLSVCFDNDTICINSLNVLF